MEQHPNFMITERLERWRDFFIANLHKVDLFFNTKFADLKLNYKKLKNNVLYLENQNKFNENNFDKATTDTLSYETSKAFRKYIKNNLECNVLRHLVTYKDKAKDDIGYASSWMRATSDLYINTSWLEGFANTNEIASRVLIQKIAKLNINTSTHLLKTLLKELDRQHFVNKVIELEEFKTEIKKYYAEQFTDNDLVLAESEFDERLNGPSNFDGNFVFYFCIGVLATIIMFWPIVFSIPYSKY